MFVEQTLKFIIFIFIIDTVAVQGATDGSQCFEPCHSEQNPNACAKTVFECVRPYLKQGKLVGRAIDPLKFDHLVIDRGPLFMSNVTDLVVTGAGDYIIKSAVYNVNAKSLQFKCKIEKLKLKGKFSALLLGSKFLGDLNGDIDDIRYTVDMDGRTPSRRCDDLVEVDMKISSARVLLTNMGNNITKMTLDNQKFIEQLKSRLENIMIDVYCKLVENILPMMKIPT